jgi:hypothetical protein
VPAGGQTSFQIIQAGVGLNAANSIFFLFLFVWFVYFVVEKI